jgi:hypothetical protein
MAGVLVYAVVSAGIKVHDLVQDKRSPLLPSPPTSDGQLSHHMSLRKLKRLVPPCHSGLQ